MPYNANIPQATDQLSQSQLDLLNNFQSINTFVNVNHVGFNVANQGKHKFVEFPVQSPAPTTIAGEVGLYCRQSTITNQPELVFSHQLGSTAPTSAKIVEFTSAGWSNPGWCRLPSGILIKWGTATVNGLTTIVMPTTFGGFSIPAFASTPFIVNFTLQNIGTSLTAMAYWNVSTTTNLALGVNSANISFGTASTSALTWIAIGV